MMDIFEFGDPRYAAQVMPELFPKERQAVLANWSEEDREAYCGEYPNERRADLVRCGSVCREGGCGRPGPGPDWCGGCCDYRGGCRGGCLWSHTALAG